LSHVCDDPCLSFPDRAGGSGFAVSTGLLRENKPINFNTVAQSADVTKSYLYTKADIRARIEALRVSPIPPTQPRSLLSHERTEASKDLLLAAKDRRMKALEEENSRLKEDLKKALGKLYEKV
jgi:hypothetical protein